MLNGTTVFINNALRQAGLLTLTADAEGNPVVDWTRTKAFAQRSVYVYVNLKGRDPQGIVEPGEEYEQVRSRVIDALYAIREPGTGRRPVALAVRSEDGGIVGVHRGDHVGDVVYLMDEGFGTLFPFSEEQVYARGYRGFGNAGDWRRTEALFGDRVWSHHGSQLPGLTYGLSSEKAILIMAGPGIKRGTVLPGPVWIIDAAPTVASLLGIPRPAQASGRVLEEALAP
jgi:predicted AlkP superfamily phosphohydrolase/phosphomutase